MISYFMYRAKIPTILFFYNLNYYSKTYSYKNKKHNILYYFETKVHFLISLSTMSIVQHNTFVSINSSITFYNRSTCIVDL